jgi:hypothetical protein
MPQTRKIRCAEFCERGSPISHSLLALIRDPEVIRRILEQP